MRWDWLDRSIAAQQARDTKRIADALAPQGAQPSTTFAVTSVVIVLLVLGVIAYVVWHALATVGP